MSDERERDWVADEIAAVTERRDQLVAATDKNPHLASAKTRQQLQILDRQLADLQETAA